MQTETRYWKFGRGEVLLYIGLAAGPAAWAINLGVCYSASQHVCSTSHLYVFYLTNVFTFALAIAGFLAARAAWRELPEEPDHESGDPIGRGKFMSLLGQMCSLGFALVVLAGAIPVWMMPPCG